MMVDNFIARLRLKAGLTQSQLASAIGVSKNAISAYENGEYNPSLEVAIQLSRFFDVPLYPGLFYTDLEVDNGGLFAILEKYG